MLQSSVSPEYTILYKCDPKCGGCKKIGETCSSKSDEPRIEEMVFHWVMKSGENGYAVVKGAHDVACHCIGDAKLSQIK